MAGAITSTCCPSGWVPTPTGEEATVPLASPSDDPRVQEGLRHILQLDRRLMQKSAQLALVARDTFPDKWEAADRKQAQRDEQLLLDSLNRCVTSRVATDTVQP